MNKICNINLENFNFKCKILGGITSTDPKIKINLDVEMFGNLKNNDNYDVFEMNLNESKNLIIEILEATGGDKTDIIIELYDNLYNLIDKNNDSTYLPVRYKFLFEGTYFIKVHSNNSINYKLLVKENNLNLGNINFYPISESGAILNAGEISSYEVPIGSSNTAAFINSNDDIYPLLFPTGGLLRFNAKSNKSEQIITFQFNTINYNERGNTRSDSFILTQIITNNFETYSLNIAPQDNSNIYTSIVMYIGEPNKPSYGSNVSLKNISVSMYEVEQYDPEVIDLKKGWNLIGSSYNSLIEYNESIVPKSLYEYGKQGLDNEIDYLEANKGYWIKTTDSIIIKLIRHN